MAGFQNLSSTDRILRTLAGLGLLLAGWTGVVPGLGGIACTVFGWAPLITGALGWSPIYSLLRFSTRRPRRFRA